MILKLAVLAALAAAIASPALAGGMLPDGTYDCMLDNGYLAGSMEIVGNSYKGPAFDGKYEGAYPFETGPQGGLFLKGPWAATPIRASSSSARSSSRKAIICRSSCT